jgi:fibro-slime domain-containing protein
VNGSLAVDLGGRHVPEGGSVTLDTTTASSYGLVDGEPYEVLIFHANRNGESSSLRMQVTGAHGLGTRCVE